MPPVSPNGRRVLQLDRLVEVGGLHDAEHRTEPLLEMGPGPGRTPTLTPGDQRFPPPV